MPKSKLPTNQRQPPKRSSKWTCPVCKVKFAPTNAYKQRHRELMKEAKHLNSFVCPSCANKKRTNTNPQRAPKNAPRLAKSTRGVRATGRLAQRGTLLPTRQRGVRASQYYLATMLNPKATMGSKAVKFKSDAVQTPRVAYNFNSVFTISPNVYPNYEKNFSNEFKIKFLPSPLIVAEVHTKGRLNIGGVPHVEIYNIDGSVSYFIIGSKVEQLGMLDGHKFKPRADWAKYRCIGYSAGSMWVGREIDKAGVVYAARMNEEVPLDKFNPTLKQDAIFGRAFQEQSYAGTHKEPVYDWAHADPNEAALDPDHPDGPSGDKSITFVYNASHVNPDYNRTTNRATVYTYGTPTPSYPDALGFGLIRGFDNQPGNIINDLCLTASRQDAQTFVELHAAINKFSSMYPTSTTVTPAGTEWTHNLNLSINVSSIFFPYSGGPTSNYSIDGIKSSEFFVEFTESEALYINDQVEFMKSMARTISQSKSLMDFITNQINTFGSPAKNSGDLWFGFDVRVVSNVLLNKPLRENHQRGLREYDIYANVQWDDASGMFHDDTWASPVAYFSFPTTPDNSDQYMMQFVHQTNLELIVDDTSPLANFAIAQESNSVDTVVDQSEKRLQRVMQALPPMVTFDNGQLGSTSTTELASRGVIKDIADLLGPLAAAMFPQFAPLIGGAQALAGAFDNLLLS